MITFKAQHGIYGTPERKAHLFESHGLKLGLETCRGGYRVHHLGTGLKIQQLDAIATQSDPVTLKEAKEGIAAMMEIMPEYLNAIKQAVSECDPAKIINPEFM